MVKNGTFNTILAELQADAHAEGDLERVVSIDSSNARAHEHAAGAARVNPAEDDQDALFPAPDTGGKIE